MVKILHSLLQELSAFFLDFPFFVLFFLFIAYICGYYWLKLLSLVVITEFMPMAYREIAQLELMNALNNIKSEADLKDFRNLLAHFFAEKA